MQVVNNVNPQANNAFIASAILQADVAPIPTIIPRQDLYGNVVVFFADSENKEDDTIEMWTGKKGDKRITVSMKLYHTAKLISKEAAQEVGKRFCKEFGVKDVVVRQRRFREGKITHEGVIEAHNASEVKTKLLSAIDQFTSNMRQYVEDSFKTM